MIFFKSGFCLSFLGCRVAPGKSGKDIPEEARIICLADSYDAMTSKRSYSSPKPQNVVRAEIERCMGTQFDPDIARFMLDMMDEDTEFKLREIEG